MTATIEPAQGQDFTDRAKTHTGASTKIKALPEDTTAFDFASPRASCCAWKKTAPETDREYLSVKLDDPSVPAPIYASLVKSDGDHSYTLIWSAATATDPTESNGHVLFGAGVRARTQRGSYSDLSFESACCGAVRIMTIAARLRARGRTFDSCRQRAGTVLTVPAMPITRRRRRLHALPWQHPSAIAWHTLARFRFRISAGSQSVAASNCSAASAMSGFFMSAIRSAAS